MYILPSRTTKQVKQTNRGKILGDLWSSWNIDLQTNPGLINVGKKMKLNVSSGTETNMTLPVAFQYFDSMMWALGGNRIYKNGASDIITAFTEDASSGFVTTYDVHYGDMATFNSTLIASAPTKIWSKANNGSGTGAWSEIGSNSLTTSTNHKLCYFKKFDRMYVMNNKTDIKSFDTGGSVASSGDYFIDLGDDIGRAITMIATDNRIFIGTLQNTGIISNTIAEASVLEWDGISANVTAEYKIPAQGVMAATLLNGIPVIMDSNGILRIFNQSGFQEIGRLPLNKEFLSSPLSTFNDDRFMHPNGLITTRNGTILALINNVISDSASSIKENLPSGIWEWSKENGFVHKHPITYQPVATTTLTDNGQNRIVTAGALANANVYSTSASGRGTIIAGVKYYTDASSSLCGIFIDAPIPTDNVTTTEGRKYGYFVTQWLQASGLRDSWSKLAIRYRKLLNSSDRIIVKYRTTEVDPTYISMTWVNTTSFTTTTDVSGMVGYEVEILQGTGSGKCAHITAVSFSSPNYTVTVDETFTGVTTGTAKARTQAWNKNMEISDQTTESRINSTGVSSERIQIKVCLEFTNDDEFHELIVVNKDHTLLI